MEDGNRQIRGRAKGLMALVLTLMLVFGNSLTVLAASYSVGNADLTTTFTRGKKIDSGDDITWTGTSGLTIYVDNTFAKKLIASAGGGSGSSSTGDDNWLTSADYWVAKVNNGGDSGSTLYLSTTEVSLDTADDDNGREEQSGGGQKHTHSFQWQIVKQPTETEDGLSQNICTCGLVDGEQPVSSATGFINAVRDAIAGAPEGGTVEISTEYYRCYTAKVINALLERSDVTLVTTYLAEDGTWKSFTISAGSAPSDGAQFYGFTGLGNTYGWN